MLLSREEILLSQETVKSHLVGGILVGAIAPCLYTVIYCSLQSSLECKKKKVVTSGRFLVLWRVKRTGDLYVNGVAVGAVFG